MTRAITVLIVVFVLFAGWSLFKYYQQVEEESKNSAKAAAVVEVRGENLPGLPNQLTTSFQTAQQNGPVAMRAWLNAYGTQVKDPRKAWIEMDYAIAIYRDDPNEAKRVFNAMKERVATNSPVYPRVRQLEKTFE
jgi:hypothetical protein